jgi:hypothetical protein
VKAAAQVDDAARRLVPPPARQMSFRLAETASGPAVQVHLRDQAGELRVAVRTADGELAQSLGERLPELVQQLGRQGYETQVWRPVGGPGSPAEPNGPDATAQKTDLRGGAGDESGSKGDRDSPADRRGSSRQDDPRAWSEEWQESMGATQKP